MLKKETAALFELTTDNLPKIGHYGLYYGSINIEALTPAEAEKLVVDGFPHLRRKSVVLPVEVAPAVKAVNLLATPKVDI